MGGSWERRGWKRCKPIKRAPPVTRIRTKSSYGSLSAAGAHPLPRPGAGGSFLPVVSSRLTVTGDALPDAGGDIDEPQVSPVHRRKAIGVWRPGNRPQILRREPWIALGREYCAAVAAVTIDDRDPVETVFALKRG